MKRYHLVIVTLLTATKLLGRTTWLTTKNGLAGADDMSHQNIAMHMGALIDSADQLASNTLALDAN